MTEALRRRGPDSEGLADWPGASLGHRRLAIIDLSEAGRQPMLSEDGKIGLVFNGCIYNFRELRGELEKLGHRFRSQCDTEVLLHGYRAWGADELVKRARGMFAFAIWDEPRRTLTLARDRLGVKPLLYSAGPAGIAFASTIDALRKAGFGSEIDPAAVLDVLEFGFVTEERAIFTGIGKLPPATILEWRDGVVAQRSYWSLPAARSPQIAFEEAVEETERLLLESVRLRLVSDVPIGVLLSGGIDSALVCWAMREANANIKAFTVRAPGDPSDETAAATRTAQLLGIAHEVVDMPAEDFDLSEYLDAYGEPFAAESAQAMLWVSRSVKRLATVLLTGDGGDDAFLGYPFFRNAWLAQRLARRLPDSFAAFWRGTRQVLPAAGPLRRGMHLLDFATGGIGEHARAHDGIPYFERRSMFGERLAGAQLAQRQIPPSVASARRLLDDVFAYHLRLHFTSEFMPKVDGGTMYYAIEARAPLLDQKIWEFAASLPAEICLRGGVLKAVLREIVRRRIDPEVAQRPKQGFVVPVERWLAERWSGMLAGLRGGTMLEQEGWIRRGTMEGPLREAARNGRVPLQIWRLLLLEQWMRRQAQEKAPALAGAGAVQAV
jgi:asparagine synthase (glutamine-hydrolysing)